MIFWGVGAVFGWFVFFIFLLLLFWVKIVENDLIYFGEKNSINIRAAFVNFAISKHKIGQTQDVFVINILMFSFSQVKVNIQSRLQHCSLFGLWNVRKWLGRCLEKWSSPTLFFSADAKNRDYRLFNLDLKAVYYWKG